MSAAAANSSSSATWSDCVANTTNECLWIFLTAAADYDG